MKKYFSLVILGILLIGTAWAQASLPTSYAWDPSTSLPTGWTNNGMGSYTTGHLAKDSGKFDTTGDNLVIYFNAAPGALTYWLKGNPSSGSYTAGTFLIQESTDGSSYSTMRTVTNKDNTWELFTDNPSSTTRYIKLLYSLKTSGNIAIDEVSVASGSVSAPTSQASNITFSSVQQNQMTIGWTIGNGSKRIVKINTTNSFSNPTDGTDPTATAAYGGSGEQVVYNNNSNSVTVTGLSASTTYWFRVYEYNGSGTSTKYQTSTTTNNPNSQQTSAPTPTITTGAVSTPPFYVDSSTQATGSVAFTSTGTYSSATFTAKLSDASGSFTSPSNIGTTAANGTNPSGNISITIPAGTSDGTGYKIRIDCASPAVTGSESAAFTIQNGAKNVTGASSAVNNGSLTVSWSNPTSIYDEIMIVVKATSSVSGTPSGDGTAYTPSLAFGGGTGFDSGFVVYKGSSSPQTITGLTNGTLYYAKLFTRKNSNWSTGVEISGTPAIPPTLIHYWNFNTGNPTSPDSWASSISAAQGTGIITYNFNSPTSFTGYTLNGVTGEVAGGSFVPTAYTLLENNGKYFQMAIPTDGFEGIVVSYVTRGTDTGFSSQEIQYSTNGVDFVTKETISGTNNTTASVKTINISSISAASNNSNFKIRIVVTGATNESGNNRFDNIQITGYAIAYDYPAGIPVVVGDETITVSGGNANNGSGTPPAWTNPSFTPSATYSLTLIGTGPWTVTIATTALWGAFYQNGQWYTAENVGGSIVFNISPTKDEIVEIILGDQDPTLPVELSSFTATLTSQNTVNIMWVTQTETNVNGYYVYRGSSSELNAAAAVSSLIGAYNTSQQQVYQFTDTEVFEPGTYYYWLQVQDLDGSIQFHGPTTVYFDNEGNNGTPVIPKVTELKSIYPNPFNPSTTIYYSLAKAETVDFVIYNNRGQIVRSFNEGNRGIGNHSLRWNGEDQYGRSCSTGIYYIKMTAGKDSFIRKAVLMK